LLASAKLMANPDLVAQLAKTQALTVDGASRDHVRRHV